LNISAHELMAQHERELTLLENVDEINETSAVADQVIHLDVSRSLRVPLEIPSNLSTHDDWDYVEIGVLG